MKLKWDPCVAQTGDSFLDFLSSYLDQPDRKCLVIGGAGFDPRATIVPKYFAKFRKGSVKGLFFREERLHVQQKFRPLADNNEAVMLECIPDSRSSKIYIFSEGKTVIGGRSAVQQIELEDFSQFTDIIVEISALSSGVFFSIVRYCLVRCQSIKSASGKLVNLHLLAVEEPSFDHRIRGVPSDIVTWLHGFRGTGSLDSGTDKALLWLPTLAPGSLHVLNRIYSFISRPLTPIDVCPILPFPCQNPRMPDSLVEEYREVLPQWKTDTRNFLHAAESDPLDCYRTICSICDSRSRTFKDLAGSTVVLSPVGNKLLGVGAMLAAIDRNLPVAMVESIGYDEEVGKMPNDTCDLLPVNHFWLFGEAYF